MIPAGNEFFMTEVMEWQHEKDGAQSQGIVISDYAFYIAKKNESC